MQKPWPVRAGPRKTLKTTFMKRPLVPVELGDRGGRRLDKKWVKEDMVSLTRTPSDVIVVVAGGAGKAYYGGPWLWYFL